MKNKDKYQDELNAVLVRRDTNCIFRMKKILLTRSCKYFNCLECDRSFEKWLEEEYDEQNKALEHEWSKYPRGIGHALLKDFILTLSLKIGPMNNG